MCGLSLIHILQSGSDKILGLMRRRYTTARFADRIAAVRALMPDAFIGIDVIVGFPGETEEDFRTTYDFLAGLEPAFLHIFPFSERPGTPAVEMPGNCLLYTSIYFQISYIYYIYAYIFISRHDRIRIPDDVWFAGVQ